MTQTPDTPKAGYQQVRLDVAVLAEKVAKRVFGWAVTGTSIEIVDPPITLTNAIYQELIVPIDDALSAAKERIRELEEQVSTGASIVRDLLKVRKLAREWLIELGDDAADIPTPKQTAREQAKTRRAEERNAKLRELIREAVDDPNSTLTIGLLERMTAALSED